ncbi:MAG: hypothetical protein ACLQU1_14450 [Bryobacteraceae bacterium]
MRVLWTIPFLLAGVLWADEAADRRAIESVIAQLNHAEERPDLFAAGTDVPAELRRLERANCNTVDSSGIWTEVTRPKFTHPTVQFITPDVALADLENVQYGSIVPAIRAPIVVILKREAGQWKIAALRVTAACFAMRVLPASR